jgi:hypothetical protein
VTGRRCGLAYRDVEVQHVFADSKLRIEGDRGCIGKICLHEDDICPSRGGDTLEVPDQSSRDAFAPI